MHAFVSATAFHQERSFNFVNGHHSFPVPGASRLLSGVDVRDRCYWLDFNSAKFAGGHSEMGFFGGFNGAVACSQQRDPC